MNNAARNRRLMENYTDMRILDSSNYQIRRVEPENMEHYYILITPSTGIYKGHKYVLELKTKYGRDEDVTTYPFNVPYIHFVTNIHHVNVSKNGGTICLDILKDKSLWSPANNFETIVQCILVLLDDPNTRSPYNNDASLDWHACFETYKTIKNLKKKKMTETERDAEFIEYYKPFIDAATVIMNNNDIKYYGKWFPLLDPNHSDFNERVKKDEEELQEAIKINESFKKKKEKKVSPTSKPNKNKWDKYNK